MSTLPEEWEGLDADYDFEPNAAESDYPATVPVRVVYSENEQVPPGFASFMTWPIGQIGVAPGATQLLSRREHRYKAKLVINFPAAGSITFNSKQEPLTKDLNPQGFTVTVAAAGNFTMPDYDAAQPLYAMASIAGCTIAVIDETYGQVQ